MDAITASPQVTTTATRERRTLRSLPEAFQLQVLELPSHLYHCSTEPEAGEEPLRDFVLLRGPQDHARRADRAEPVAGGLDERARHAVPLGFGCDDDVMDETGRFPQFLPGLRLQPCVDVTNYAAGPFCNEYRDIVFLELAAQKPRVSGLRIALRRHAALLIERVVRAEERGAEDAQ